MITKITLNNVASYKNSTSLETDKKYNLIYGLNGAGKTILANYFYNKSSFPNCSIEGLNEEEFLVYTQQFIYDYFYQPDNLKGIFTLSKENKEAIEKVNNANNKITTLEKQKTDKATEKGNIENKLNQKISEAEEKIWEIKTKYAGGDKVLEYCLIGSMGSKKALFKKILEITKPENQPNETIEQLKKEAGIVSDSSPQKKESLPQVRFPEDSIENSLLFQKQIVGNDNSSVSELIKKLNNADWVKTGLDFSQESHDRCPFCQQDITPQIIENIKEFFDEAYENDIKELKKLQTKYNTAVTSIRHQNLYTNNQFITEQKSEFENLYNSLMTILNTNEESIQKKISSPSKIIKLQNSLSSINNLNEFLSVINAKITEYNNKIDNKIVAKDNITKIFWNIMRCEYDQTISNYLKEKNEIEKSIKKINEEISKIESNIKEQNGIVALFQKNTINIEEAISNINNALIELGADTFSIEKYSDNLYKIKRTEDCDFKTLSEGEKMIISFLYFCELCKGKKTATSQNTKKIIVIDDPISSLSHIWIFNVAQLIRENFFKETNYEQVFILTHNLYFFYELTNVIGVKQKDSNKKKLKLFRIVKNTDGSKFLPMQYDDIKNDYQSYWSIVNDGEKNYNKALVANCMRNILEYFFGFVKNIDLKDLFQEDTFESIKYQSFLRYMNRKSHSTERNIFDTSEFDYNIFNEAFKLVFTKSGYTEHYKTMSGKEAE
ncbi:MAG: AAA family ATPase [Endomicrobium sp.]|jgi:wobble nucleotide-excising tRNase|nr:AAA family ATPase [Endomicrobium sp.]